MPSKFISDKTAEATAAAQAGNSQRVAQVLTEAINENDADFKQTVTAMTQAAEQNSR
ncbi:hypothetical protein [Streptomyces formicae]